MFDKVGKRETFSEDEQRSRGLKGMAHMSRLFAASGLTTVHDAQASRDQILSYEDERVRDTAPQSVSRDPDSVHTTDGYDYECTCLRSTARRTSTTTATAQARIIAPRTTCGRALSATSCQ